MNKGSFPCKRPGLNDHETMKDMIRSGTKPDDFILFWYKEAGYTLQSARTIFYRLKKAIDNGK